MIDKLKIITSGIVKTKTFRQSGITFLGTIITGILGLVFYIVVARDLGPADFGIFSIVVASLTLVAGIFDVGTNTGIVRFAAKYFRSDRRKSFRYLKLGLEVKIIAWLIALVVGWFLVPPIAISLLRKPELIFPIRISLIGVGGSLLFSFSTYAAQALQRFWVWSGLNMAMNGFRLLVILVFVYLGSLTIDSAITIYIVFPFLGFLTGLLFLPNFIGVDREWSVSRKFFSYNKWVAAFTIVAVVSARLDTFLSARLLPLDQVGIYSVAKNLSDIVPQIVFALAVVVAPKLSAFNLDHKKAIPYLKKLQIFTLSLSALGLAVGIPLARVLISAFYGVEYTESIFPFIILLVAQAIFFISIPVHTSVFYYFSYPKLFIWISLGNLAIIGGLGWFMISSFGFVGAAWTVLVGNIFNLLVPGIWVVNKFRKVA